MSKLIFAHDVYLEFPIKETYWKDFFEQHDIQLKPYNDIDQMVLDLKEHHIHAAFLPAGGYYYLAQDAFYQGIASATIGKEKALEETAHLLVKKNSGFKKVEDLKQKNFTYINKECTTSFLGLLIYLSQHHIAYKDFIQKMTPSKGFYGQIEEIQHNPHVHATMLWDLFYNEDPALQEKTDVIGTINHLPTPLIILNTEVDESFKQVFVRQLLNYVAPPSWKYSGFVHFQKEMNQAFWNKIIF